MRKIKSVIALLLVLAMTMSNITPVFADQVGDMGGIPAESQESYQLETGYETEAQPETQDNYAQTETEAIIVEESVVSDEPQTSYIEETTVEETETETVEETDDAVELMELDAVAMIGDVEYETLQEAINAAAFGGTITLLQNINTSEQIEVVGKAITLDLSVYTIAYTGDTTLASGVVLVHNGAGLTIAGNGTIDAGTKAYAAVALTKKGDDASSPAVLTVENGTLKGYLYGITGNGTRPNTQITIKGGTVEATCPNDGVGIYQPQGTSTTIINDGTIIGYSSAIEVRAGNLVIKGGALTATADSFSCNPNGNGTTTIGAAVAVAQHTTKKDISVKINGGTLTGVKALNESNPQGNDPTPRVEMTVNNGTFVGEVTTADVDNFIYGGTFDRAVPGKYCAEGMMPEDNGDGTYGVTKKPLEEGYITIRGKIEFDEKVDGVDWKDLVRPMEFDQDFEIELTYIDDDGVEQKLSYYAQDALSNSEFYLKFIHDGDGGGEFSIENVPKTVTVGDKVYQVKHYSVNLCETLPYYTSEPIEQDFSENLASINGTLKKELMTESVKLTTEVLPEGSVGSPEFEFSATFTYDSSDIETIKDSLSGNYKVTPQSFSEIHVPVGIQYEITQKLTDGYKFDGNYTTIVNGDPDTATKDVIAARGTVEHDMPVKIHTVNYDQNVTVKFDALWIDNNSATRPSLTRDNFILEYRTEDGDWKELASEDFDQLDISHLPGFSQPDQGAGEYAFYGMPALDKDNKPVEYRVNIKQIPEGYTYSETVSDEKKTFVFEEKTDFSAFVNWRDASDAQGKRPETLTLNLYRTSDSGYDEAFSMSITEDMIVKEGNSWRINIMDLPRYNNDNEEYDYILVQGEINEGQIQPAGIDNYRTYYNNGTGVYGNDIHQCHDGGIINELYVSDADFSAKKVWMDPDDQDERPIATVTLWRYVKGEAADIDDAYLKEKAAQVVFQLDGDTGVTEHIVQYNLNSSADESDIFFSFQTVSGLPETFKLPGCDGQGREYVYFVREALSGAHADLYEICYVGEDGKTYKYGVPTGGTIKNIRREKVAVSVTKMWKNPSGLSNITGSKVVLDIKAPLKGKTEYVSLDVLSAEQDSYDILTDVEKKQTQTIGGFSETMSSGETTYYVNRYDHEGHAYDLENAILSEKIYNAADNLMGSVDPGIEYSGNYFYLNGEKYVANSQYTGSVTLGDGTTQYRYIETNTISATREYRLTKEWHSSILKTAYTDIACINYKLERKSTKDAESKDEDKDKGYVYVDTYSVSMLNGSIDEKHPNIYEAHLDLDKYDSDGYEYIYRASEVSFTLEDGTTMTVEEAAEKYNWSRLYHRTPSGTTAVNYISTSGGSSYFTVSKTWVDNGDDDHRKPIEIRVYDRNQLKTQLEYLLESGKTPADRVVISEFDKYKAYTLDESGEFTTEVVMDDALRSATRSEAKGWTGYVVLESGVGSVTADGASPAQYKIEDLMTACSSTQKPYTYVCNGIVENTDRMYDVNVTTDDDGTVIITNVRKGITELTIEKVWQDDSDISGNRPGAIQFQLMQDGHAYRYIPEDITVEGDGATLDKDNGVITVSSSAEKNPETGEVIKPGASSDKWSFKVKGLPMFDSAANIYAYNVDEVVHDVENTPSVDYIRRKTDTKIIEAGEKTQNIQFDFMNTITGYTEHFAYKYWEDDGIGPDFRPDLYMTLYRYKISEAKEKPDVSIEKLNSFEKYIDYKDQLWTREPDQNSDDDTTDLEHGYNWKVTIKDLPRFDENGSEYIYLFKESMNHEGETIRGTYVQTSEIKKIAGKEDETYEVFTNTITDTMRIKGLKTWTGLAGYQTKADDLPDPLIELYRTTDSEITSIQSKSKQELENLINAGKLTLIDTTRLNEKKTNYEFPKTVPTDAAIANGYVVRDGDEYLLPKFDPQGHRYIYLVREIIEDQIADQIYSKTNVNGTIVNIFRKDINRRSITVTKDWSSRLQLLPNENEYPSVTYKLYRYEMGREDSTTELIKTYKFNSDEFKANPVVSHNFEDLLIFSPTGAQYGYYITEDAIAGYAIDYTDEPAIRDGSLIGEEVYTGRTNKLEITEDMINTLRNNQRIDIISLPKDWNKVTDSDSDPVDTNTRVGTTNDYNQKGSITIAGQKVWRDFANKEGLRPESITLKITRRTNNESGQSNAVKSEELTILVKDAEDPSVTVPYIVWNQGQDATTSPSWDYKVYNLERYAPNGMPYIYSVSELQVEGYKKTKVVEKAATADSLTMDKITNEFDGQYSVRKNWMDGNNKYELRPKNITVVLQRSKDNGTTWENISWDESCGSMDAGGKWTGLPSVTTDKDGEPIVSALLTTADVVKYTKNNSWAYTFTNLPVKYKKQDGSYGDYLYRCIETEIGGAEITTTVDDTTGVEKQTAGAYAYKVTGQTSEKTTMENTLDSTKLIVTKNWIDDQDDQDDYYKTRPEMLTFKLQKRGVVVEKGDDVEVDPDPVEPDDDSDAESDLSDWMDVTLADGKPYTFTISAKDNWTKELPDLPVAEIVDIQGKAYVLYSLYFRAIEVHADGSEDLPQGALNYIDKTNYELGTAENPNNDHRFEDNHNISQISNELIKSHDIHITKVWNRTAGEEVTSVFELMYKTKDEITWHCYGNQSLTTNTESNTVTCEDWSEHTEDQGCLVKISTSQDAKTESLEWTGLPKYDREGHELVYAVVEHPVAGYKTEIEQSTVADADYTTDYTFTNIELQDYIVQKIWQNADYAHKTAEGFTATFVLQQKAEDAEDWTTVTDSEITLTSTAANDASQTYTWKNLPMYTNDAAKKQIIYRAVETKINGIAVNNDTNGQYVVTYTYDMDEPLFKGEKTTATNRMVYGFVNMSKTAAYLLPEVTEDNKKLEEVVFDIYVKDNDTEPYVSSVKTDENGNLCRNDDGTYGTEHRYLIAGAYTLKEKSTNPDYSVWQEGVDFTIGINGEDEDTGEHGTAWVSTKTTILNKLLGGLSLNVVYIPNSVVHSFVDECAPVTPVESNEEPAYNIESRGTLSFTKTGPGGVELNLHAGATDEVKAYFGVYTDDSCTKLVAGMSADSTGKVFVLNNKKQDGTLIDEGKNEAQIPYLRKLGQDAYSLLSGTYYIKEIVAPSGYKLDKTIRKAVIEHIASIPVDKELSDLYTNNKAKITILGSDETGVSDYQWSNEPNKVSLYKLDQFGKTVTLKDGGCLELKVNAGKFTTSEDTIYLYQNENTAATNKAKTVVLDNVSYKNGVWTFTDVFDPKKIYTLSEPATSVPDTHIVAKSMTFTVDADGLIQVISDDSESKDNPTSAKGDDYDNYYKADVDGNVLVLRDTSRYYKNVQLKKVNSGDDTKLIPNISFELYRYESKKDDGTLTGSKSVLQSGQYLTTDAAGKIVLKEQNEAIKNVFTNCALKYGLEVGKYYFKEIEKGASDAYRIGDPIFFEITPDTKTEYDSYEDYAQVKFESTAYVSQQIETEASGAVTGVVKNDPVDKYPKTLKLLKKDSKTDTDRLKGAEFTLEYVSITDGQSGSQTKPKESVTTICVTGDDGYLYVKDRDKVKPDISKKGSYTLIETKAPNYYMTRTGVNDQPVVFMTFKVNSENKFDEVKCYDELVSATVESDGAKEHIILDADAKNEKTVVHISKKNDLKNGKKTKDQMSVDGEPLEGAELEIYLGTDLSGTPFKTAVSSKNSWVLTGDFIEDTIYTLHETKAPIGYMIADDIVFKIHGTTKLNDTVIAQPYVWTGTGTPKVDGDGWVKVDNIINMVDEVIIAPVDMQKVVGDSTYEILPGAKFDIKVGDTPIGTAVSGENGYIEWRSLESAASGLVYDAEGSVVTNLNSMIGKTIILKQNEEGYTFTETYAPDNAFNNAGSYAVNITVENYMNYKTSKGYNTNAYIDVVAASRAVDHTVATLNKRDSTDKQATATDLVNPAFVTHFELYKYDAEHPLRNADHNGYDKIGMAGVEFTLERKTGVKADDGSDAYEKVDTYTTKDSPKGLLTFDIANKGTYRLTETKTLEGYKLSDKVMEFTIVNEDYNKTLTFSDSESNVDHTVVVKNRENQIIDGVEDYDIPNWREHGSMTMIKKDDDSGKPLNDVKYILTRTSPVYNSNVDHYFPSENVTEPSKNVTELALETGKVYGNIASATTFEEIEVKDGTAGEIKLNDLQWGTYTLVEQQELDGYIFPDPDTKVLTFEIKADQLNVTVSDEGKNYVANIKNALTITKVTADEEMKQLEGGEFVLYKVTDDKASTEPSKFYTSIKDTEPSNKTTITSGKTTIYGLTKGTYVLHETKAPNGYELALDVRFELTDKGIVQNLAVVEIAEDDRSVSAIAEAKPNDTVVQIDTELKVKDVPIEVSFKKVDKEQIEKGLKGAVYQIIGTSFRSEVLKNCASETKNGKTYVTLDKTNDDGIVEVPSALLVAEEQYILHEHQAPDGYKVGEDVTFRVLANGTLQLEGDPQNASLLDLDGEQIRIQLSDEIIKASIHKIDNSNPALNLKGVKFVMTPMRITGEHQDHFADNSSSIELSTDDNGKANIPTGLLVHDNYYTLTETDIGNNDTYKLPDAASFRQIHFKVNKDGTLSFVKKNADGTYTDSTVSTSPENGLYSLSNDESTNETCIVVTNEKIKLEIGKKDKDANTSLAGAELVLAKKTDSSWVKVESWITESSVKLFDGLATGNYRLTETKVPADYRRITESFYFKVNQNGTITATDKDGTEIENWTDTSVYSIVNPDDGQQDTAIQMTVINEKYKTELKITKENSSKQKLKGVEFTIEKIDSGDSKNETNPYDTTVKITDVNGICSFENLTNGQYRVTETKTVDGYNLLSSAIIFEINRQDVDDQGNSQDTKAFWWYEGDTGNKAEVTIVDDVISFTLKNKQGFTLPATGVSGNQLPPFMLVIVALPVAALLLTYKKRYGKKEGSRSETN